MAQKGRDWLFRWGTRIIVLLIGGMGTFMAYPSYRRGLGLKAQDAELQRRIDRKKQEIKQLKVFQDRFRYDADFVESIARQNRRVFPGELVFVFEDE